MSSRPPRSEVRSRLLAAAAGVFASRGYAAASVEDVARAAGLTKGAVYSNFAGKDDLFFSMLGEQVAARLVSVAALPLDAASPEDGARRIGAALMRSVVEEQEWQLLFLEFWQRAMRDPSARSRFVEHRRALRDAIASAISSRAAELGHELPMPARDLATVVLALSNGLAIEHLPDPDEVPVELFGDVLAALLR